MNEERIFELSDLWYDHEATYPALAQSDEELTALYENRTNWLDAVPAKDTMVQEQDDLNNDFLFMALTLEGWR